MVYEFVSGLWLGETVDKNNEAFLIDKNINIVINSSGDLSFLSNKKEYNDIIMNNIKRYENIRFSDYLFKITEFIFTNICNNKNILIYSKKRENYSELILLAYLIRYSNLDYKKSIDIIRTKNINSFNQKFIYKNVFLRFLKKI